MMSHTIRYFKLVYIMAGLLLKNEDVCQTMDEIYIKPRYGPQLKTNSDTKQQKMAKNNARANTECNSVRRKSHRLWLRRMAYDLLTLRHIRRRLKPMLWSFNIWNIPNIFIVYSTKYINSAFDINSDCDVIYNK